MLSPFVERPATADQLGLAWLGGIRTVWQDLPAENTVMLRFRVGAADEPLPRRGFTHLAEHLALKSLRDVGYPYNGSTGLTTTTFFAQTATQTNDFLAHVISSLAALVSGETSDAAICHEAKILRAEASERPDSTIESLLGELYGARAYGLAGYPELGLTDLIVDDFREWVRDYFTLENSSIALPLTPCYDLDTGDLESGSWKPPPSTRPLDRPWPAHVDTLGQVALVSPLIRSAESGALAYLLTRATTGRLRHDAGVSYSPSFAFEALTANYGLLSGGAGIPRAGSTLGVDATVGELDRLATSGPTSDEMAWIQAQHRERCELASFSGALLLSGGADLIFGREIRSVDDVRNEGEHLNASDVAERAVEARGSLVAAIPNDAKITSRPLNRLALEADAATDPDIVGIPRPRYSGEERWAAQIYLNFHSITKVFYDASIRIKSNNAQALLTWDDGSFAVVGYRGEVVEVPAGAFTNNDEIEKQVRAWFEPWEVRPMGVRPAVLDVDRPPYPQRWPWWAAVAPPLVYLSTIDAPPGLGLLEIPSLAWWVFLLLTSLQVLRLGLRQLFDKGRRFQGRFLFEIAAPNRNRSSFSVQNEANPQPTPEHVAGALLVGWMTKRHLLQPWVEDAAPATIKALRNDKIAPSELYVVLDGVSVTDLFDEQLTPLLAWLHSPGTLTKAPIEVILDSLAATNREGRLGLDDTPWLQEQFDKRLRKSIRRFPFAVPTEAVNFLRYRRALTRPPSKPRN